MERAKDVPVAVDVTLRSRIEAEYREMPGLSLTAAQARRLFSLDRECCDAVLGSLIDSGFLRCSADGRFCRAACGDVRHWRSRQEIAEPHDASRQRVADCAPSTHASDVCEAFGAIVVAAARADGNVLPCETARIVDMLDSLPVFRGRSTETRRAVVQRLMHGPPSDDGVLIGYATAALPSQLRATAFALGIDVLLADGRLSASETTFIEHLRQLLHVRRSFARKVVSVLRAKNLVWAAARNQ